MKEIMDREIKDLIDEYPKVGRILERYGVGCVACSVGTCLLKDIVGIHELTTAAESYMMAEVMRVICPEKLEELEQLNSQSPERQTQPDQSSVSPPIQKLVREHTYIKRWADMIPRLTESLNLNVKADRDLVEKGISFIRSYADKYHHAKEENILFKYFDEELGIIKVMHADHATARSHVRVVVKALEHRDTEKVRAHLLAYATLLHEHIKKEDEILYPWMDSQLTDRRIGQMFGQFHKADKAFGDLPRLLEAFIDNLERDLEKDARDRSSTSDTEAIA